MGLIDMFEDWANIGEYKKKAEAYDNLKKVKKATKTENPTQLRREREYLADSLYKNVWAGQQPLTNKQLLDLGSFLENGKSRQKHGYRDGVVRVYTVKQGDENGLVEEIDEKVYGRDQEINGILAPFIEAVMIKAYDEKLGYLTRDSSLEVRIGKPDTQTRQKARVAFDRAICNTDDEHPWRDRLFDVYCEVTLKYGTEKRSFFAVEFGLSEEDGNIYAIPGKLVPKEDIVRKTLFTQLEENPQDPTYMEMGRRREIFGANVVMANAEDLNDAQRERFGFKPTRTPVKLSRVGIPLPAGYAGTTATQQKPTTTLGNPNTPVQGEPNPEQE